MKQMFYIYLCKIGILLIEEGFNLLKFHQPWFSEDINPKVTFPYNTSNKYFVKTLVKFALLSFRASSPFFSGKVAKKMFYETL